MAAALIPLGMMAASTAASAAGGGKGSKSGQSGSGSNVFKNFGQNIGVQRGQTTQSQDTIFNQIMNALQSFQTQQQQRSQQQQTSTAYSPYAAPLAASAGADIAAGQPLVQMSAAQMLEALRTGGVNAQIPWVSRALDTSRQAGSQGIQSLRQALSRSGMSRTLGGQADLAQAQQQNAQNIANIPVQAAQSLISQAPAYGAGLTQAGRAGYAEAMPGAMTTSGTTTGTTTGTTAGTSTTQQTTSSQEQMNSILNSIINAIQQQMQSGVGRQAETQTTAPSFWDMLFQGLGAGGSAAAGAGIARSAFK